MEKKSILAEKLSSGMYGKVFASREGQSVIKAFYAPTYSPAEIDILFRLQSSRLLTGEELFDAQTCGEDICFGIRMQRITGNLIQLLAKSAPYAVRKRLGHDYVLSLAALHEANYLHLDINCSNCFYDGVRGYLGDYGIASAVPRSPTGELSLRTYQPRFPFALRDPAAKDAKKVYTFTDRSDVFALGLVILYALTGKLLTAYFDTKWECNLRTEEGWCGDEAKYQDFFQRVLHPLNIRAHLREMISRYIPRKERKEAIDLFSRMLSFDPSQRPSIDDVCTHVFFASYRERVILWEMLPSPFPCSYAYEEKGLREVLRLVLTPRWPPFNAEMLCTAIHLFFRSYTVLPTLDAEIRAGNAYAIAVKLFYSQCDNPTNYFETEKYRGSERAIMIGLGGILRVSVYMYVYTSEELQTFLRRLIRGQINYFTADFAQIFAGIREELTGKEQQDCTVDAREAFLAIYEEV